MIHQHSRAMARASGIGMKAQSAPGFGLGIFSTCQNRPLTVLAGPTDTLFATPLVTESKARAREVRKVLGLFWGYTGFVAGAILGGMMMAVRRSKGSANG